MYLGNATLRKFVRESLVTTNPLTLNRSGVTELKKHLTACLSQGDELRLNWHTGNSYYGSNRDLTEYLCWISIGSSGSYGALWLGLDAEKRLHVAYGWNQASAPVGSLDELTELLRLCRERVVRKRGQKARHDKVRKLRHAAVIARVRDLARIHRFDYAVSESTQNLDLYLRFDGEHIVELTVPLARFDEMMPKIEEALPQLRDLVRSGITTTLRPRFAGQTRYRKWVTHQTLGEEELTDTDEE